MCALTTFCYRVLFVCDALYDTVDKLVVFLVAQMSHDSGAPVCSDGESPSLPPPIFSLSSSPPPPAFRLPFSSSSSSSSTAIARTHVSSSFTRDVRPSSSSSRFLARTLTNEPERCTRWLICTVILLSRGISIFFFFFLCFAQVKVSDEMKPACFFKIRVFKTRMRTNSSHEPR